jgi:hypothetical protein
MLQMKFTNVKGTKFNSLYIAFTGNFTMGLKLIYFYHLNCFANDEISYIALIYQLL